MYRTYGIAEWREKCLIISDEELEELRQDLANGSDGYLTSIVRLPFPEFVIHYMNRHGKSVSPNSSIGYNAFLLVDKELGLFGGYIRGEKEKHYECKKINIDLLTKLDFESFSNFILNSAARKNNKTWAKMLYLTKYIDGKTAENLNLPISKTFKRDGVDGYELEKKLELLNPGLREMVGLYLGLDGDSSRSYVDVAKTVGLCKSRTINILDLLFSAMSRTLGDMKNKLGVVERSEEEILRGDYRIY